LFLCVKTIAEYVKMFHSIGFADLWLIAYISTVVTSTGSATTCRSTQYKLFEKSSLFV